jgi:S-DNA-T family DNA segregation ATPase FtsK/SpoIIIE
MDIIADYLIKKILSESQIATPEDSGKFILRNYPKEVFESIVTYFSTSQSKNILILVDERLEINGGVPNILQANHEVMAQYRNENVQSPSVDLDYISYLVFITNETIDTLNDISTLTPDDLERDFDLLIDNIQNNFLDNDIKKTINNISKVFLKELEGVNIFSLEKFITSTIFYMEVEAYHLEEALGLALDSLNSFRCHNGFKFLEKNNRMSDIKKMVKQFRSISLALSKRVGNKTVSVEDLNEKYEECKDEFFLLDNNKIELIQQFINADSRELSANREKFSQLDWYNDYIYRLFEKSRSRTSKPLGEETVLLLEERDSDISDLEKENLREYDKLKAKDRESLKSILEPIYKKYKVVIEDHKSLRNKWDKFLYPSQTKSNDLILGLLETIKKLKADSDEVVTVQVSLKQSQSTAIMRNYSRNAMNYLHKRYSILNRISSSIEFDFQFIKDIEEKLKEKQTTDVIRKYKKGSLSKSLNELHFIVKAINTSNEVVAERKLLWSYNASSILSGYREDIEAIEKQLENRCIYANTVYRASNSEKGEKKSLSLWDYSSLASRGKNAGYRLFPIKCDTNISSKSILKSAKELFDKELFSEFDKLFTRYLDEYSWLLNQLDIKENLVKSEFDFTRVEQLSNIYSKLSLFLFEHSNSDQIKSQIVEPFLSLVTVKVANENAVIIPSYHPLRLISYFVKLKNGFKFIDNYISNSSIKMIKEDLYFSDIEQSFSTPYYPEVFRIFENEEDEETLLHISEICEDYTVLEPIKVFLESGQSTDPTSQTIILTKVIENYLSLNQHKQSSLKILLHAVDNFEFPVKFMKRLLSLNLTSEDSSFEIYLNDIDASHIREMYRAFLISQNSKEAEEALEYNEVSFLSNIRLNAFDQSFKQLDSVNDKFNIAFLNDFVSSKSKIEFREQKLEEKYPLFEYHPIMWSKRKYMTQNESSVGKYLTAPANSELTSSFYNLLYLTMSTYKDDYKDKIPTLSVDRRHTVLHNNLDAIHKRTDWVVNLDSLLDKKILEEFGANVIKYRKARHINRNLVVSSKANTILLESHLRKKFRNFNIHENLIDNAVDNIIKSANELSGDILLKAIGKGHFANEMLGLVLTKTLLYGCSDYDNILIYIDDYADWFLSSIDSEEKLLLTQENVLADILLITPVFVENELTTIYIDIVEAKFCNETNRAKHSKKSLQQTKESFLQIKKVFEEDNYIDKPYWLAKISDLIVETHHKSFVNGLTSEDIRNKMRLDNGINYVVRGISCVFVYDYEDTIEQETNMDGLSQYIIGSKSIVKMIESVSDFDVSLLEGLALPKYQGMKQKENVVKKEEVVEEVEVKVVENKIDDVQKGIEKEKLEVSEVSKGVQAVVMHHKHRAKIKKHLFTPNTLRVSLEPELGWKPKMFYDMSNDFLTVKGLELLRVEPVKGAYDLIFKREDRKIIHYKDCLENRELSNGFGNTKILIGRNEENNNIVYYNLDSEDPHALIGGMTKSGKSVLLNIFIIDLIRTNSVAELKLILIDPKQVEFTRYRGIPYLDDDGIITNKELAIEKLNMVVDEMERRYKLFSENSVNEINKYNNKIDEKLPRIVLIFDEFADWMLDDEFKKSASSAVQSLSGKARAAGIHLIVSTQRPDNTVVVPILRANLGAKFALRVDSEKNSNIILDEGGAENLLGYGHMIVKFAGQKLYMQSGFISDEYIDMVLSEIT